MNYHLKFSYDTIRNEIIISGNAEGLKHLADVCEKTIGKTTPAGHYHLSPKMGNTDDDSVVAMVCFCDSLRDSKKEEG